MDSDGKYFGNLNICELRDDVLIVLVVGAAHRRYVYR